MPLLPHLPRYLRCCRFLVESKPIPHPMLQSRPVESASLPRKRCRVIPGMRVFSSIYSHMHCRSSWNRSLRLGRRLATIGREVCMCHYHPVGVVLPILSRSNRCRPRLTPRAMCVVAHCHWVEACFFRWAHGHSSIGVSSCTARRFEKPVIPLGSIGLVRFIAS